MRFEFPLEGLLRVRRVEADRRRSELQRCMARMAGVQHELETLVLERQQQFEAMPSLTEGPLPMEQVRTRQRYLNLLHRREVDLAKQLHTERVRFEEAQRHHLAARRQQQAVERLRARRLEEFEDDERRLELREMDETARLMTAARQLQEGGR